MHRSTQWDQLTKRLDREVQSLPRSVNIWESSWSTERSMDALLEDLQTAEQPFLKAVHDVIDDWCESRFVIWPHMEEAVQALVGLRLETVANFTFTMSVGYPHRVFSPIPFPDEPDHEVARWLLLDWWEEHGRRMACELWVLHKWETGEG